MKKWFEKLPAWLKWVLLFLVIFTAKGCGYTSDDREDRPDNWPEWTGNYVEVTDNFYIQYTPTMVSHEIGGHVESWWQWIQDCTGTYVVLPYRVPIEYWPEHEVWPGANGVHVDNPHYIRVTWHDIHWGQLTRHEMLHMLLDEIDYDDELNRTHNHPWFSDCDTPWI